MRAVSGSPISEASRSVKVSMSSLLASLACAADCASRLARKLSKRLALSGATALEPASQGKAALVSDRLRR